MLSDNPAARLLAILEEGSKHKKEENCRTVWAKLLNVDTHDSLLMSRLGKVMNLPSDIVDTISKEFPNQQDSYKHWCNQVNNGFMQQNLCGQWETFGKFIDPHTLAYLRLTAELIQSKANTSLLEETTLSNVRDKVDDILKDVIESDFQEDVKTYLTRSLQRILVVTDEYRISGAIPVLDAMEVTLGHAFFDENYKNTLTQTELGRKIIDALAAVASSVTIAVGLPQLPETFQLLLGGGSN